MIGENYIRKVIENEKSIEEKIDSLNRFLHILFAIFFLFSVGLSFMISLGFVENSPVISGLLFFGFIVFVISFIRYVEFFQIFTIRGLLIISNFIVFLKGLNVNERIQFYSLFPIQYRKMLFEMMEEEELDITLNT